MSNSAANTITSNPSNRWKIVVAVVINIILLAVYPYVLQALNLVSGFTPKSAWVLFIAGITLVLKVLLADVASGQFDYHRHGYDFCIITMGAALSSLSLQIIVPQDLLAGLPSGWLTSFLEVIAPENIISQRIILLSTIFLLSIVSAIFTGGNSRAIREKSIQNLNLLSIINFVIGMFVFGLYLFVLLAKE
jgi:hypothetical protein